MDIKTLVTLGGSLASIVAFIVLFLNMNRVRIFIANPTIFIKKIMYEIKVEADSDWLENFLRKFYAGYDGTINKYKIRYDGIVYTVEITNKDPEEEIYDAIGIFSSEDFVEENKEIYIILLTANFQETYLRYKYRNLKKELVELSKGWYDLVHKIQNLKKVISINASILFEIDTAVGEIPNKIWDINKDLKIQIVNNKIRVDIRDSEKIKDIPKYILKSLHSIKILSN